MDELLAGCRGFGITLLQGFSTSVSDSYHESLAHLRTELLEAHGRLWHINWHTMKSVGDAMTPDGEGAIRPDFVVGDLEGQTAQGSFTDLVVGLLESQGYEVWVNDPYPGGRILRDMGDPSFGVDSVQIQMNRDLYLAEPTVIKTDGFPPLKLSLRTFTKELVEALG
jgi:N-formylglutamate deformylase